MPAAHMSTDGCEALSAFFSVPHRCKTFLYESGVLLPNLLPDLPAGRDFPWNRSFPECVRMRATRYHRIWNAIPDCCSMARLAQIPSILSLLDALRHPLIKT